MTSDDLPTEDDEGFALESCSVEVWRWGRKIRLAIRSEDSVGKCIELSPDDAMDLSHRLVATINDATFIANAPRYVDTLLARVDELKTENAELNEALQAFAIAHVRQSAGRSDQGGA